MVRFANWSCVIVRSSGGTSDTRTKPVLVLAVEPKPGAVTDKVLCVSFIVSTSPMMLDR